jgi:quinolinate synthase
MSLIDQILKLKKQRNAIILAHYYEDGNIQDIADFVGDSYQLSLAGQTSSADVILMAGVVFMAESVKMLSPNKTVLVPDLNAGCSLVKASPYDEYLNWRMMHPNGIAVTYINSSAQLKSISDVIVTSSNAEKVINSIPEGRPILFGPDRNLGRYLAKQLKRDVILWDGSCEVHDLFSAKKLYELIKKHPEAIVIAHPECDETVLQYADVIGSTSRLLEEVKKNPSKTFIIATEIGILHQMQKARPDALLIQAPGEDGVCGCNHCPYMKLNSLEKIKLALETLKPEIQLDPILAQKARIPLERMIQAAQGQQVQYPDFFSL